MPPGLPLSIEDSEYEELCSPMPKSSIFAVEQRQAEVVEADQLQKHWLMSGLVL